MQIEYKVLETENNIEREQNVRILKHFIPQLQVIRTNKQNLWQNNIELYRLKESSQGVVILEDDVVLCKDFLTKCENVISQNSQDVISMFRGDRSEGSEKGYRGGSTFAWNQCSYFPKWFCDEMIKKENQESFEKWYWEREHVWNFPNDYYVKFLLAKLKRKYYAYYPHLVQHLTFESAFGHRARNRISKYFIDDLEKQNGKTY